MLFQNISILDHQLNVIECVNVGILNDKIDYIDTQMPQKNYGPIYDGKNKLLMSGLYNTHTHTPMTLLRGYAENLALQDWLFQNIFPFEAKMTKEDVYYATLLGIAEMIRYGTISSTEMYFHTESIVKAAIESGFKMNISAGITNFEKKPLFENNNFLEEKSNYEAYHNCENGRIKADMSIHAEYTTDPKLISEFVEYCHTIDANIHVHVSETKKEVEECKERHGLTPPQYFNSLGLLDLPVTAAHCVWLQGQDFDIFADKHVNIAHCPISNLKLASGVLDVQKILDKNINLALGTDGVASNNNLNLFEEIKAYALIHKGFNYTPTLITPKQALKSATQNGALAQRRPNCGSLAVGNQADLIVIDLKTPSMMPAHNLLHNIVYSFHAADVVLAITDGKVLYKNGEYTTIDMEKVYYEVEKSRLRILSELK